MFLGNGKIFVEAHEGFYTNINANTSIIKNVRKWLASSQTDVTPSQIINLEEIETKNIASLSGYKIITWWCGSFSPKATALDKLLAFIKNGGFRI